MAESESEAHVTPESQGNSKSTIEELCEGLRAPERARAALVERLQAFQENEKATELDLSYSDLEALPEAYFTSPRVISRLKALNCIGNQLTHLPPELGACVNLKNLWCHKNQLRELPQEMFRLGACTNLKIIGCTQNRLQEIPPSLGHCVNLEELHCAVNKLKELPPELGACIKLVILDCDNNPLKKGTPRTPQELREQWAPLFPHTKSAGKT